MATKFKNGGFSYNAFDPMTDAQTKKSWDDLQKSNASKPVNYTPVWQDEADSYLKQYQDRGPFSYDYNADALYQQYKDNYVKQGQMAMMDTMGQAAAMTGGYGNSYAQTVGQMAYNQQLGQLNAVMPELYGMAYDRYQQEGQELLNQYDLYMGREAQEYSKYQDNLDNWYRENSMLQSAYDTNYSRAYGNWELGYNSAWDSYLADQENNSRIEAAKIEAESQLPEYAALDYETLKKWGKDLGNAKTFSDLSGVWSDMKTANHNPWDSADKILEYAMAQNIKPTDTDLDALEKKMIKAGLDEEEVAEFIAGWATQFGIVAPKSAYSPTSRVGGGYTSMANRLTF